MRCRFRTAVVFAAFAMPTVAPAQDEFSQILAMGVVFHEQTKAACFYEPIVAPTMEKIDRNLTEMAGPQWENTKRAYQGAGGDFLMNMGALLSGQAGGAPDECKLKGLHIGQALQLSLVFVGSEPGVDDAANRLTKMGGRAIDGNPSPMATPPPPSLPSETPTSTWDPQAQLDNLNHTRDTGDHLLSANDGKPLRFFGTLLTIDSTDNLTVRIATTGSVAVGWDVFIYCSTATFQTRILQGFDEELEVAAPYLVDSVAMAAERYCPNSQATDTED